MEGDREVLVSWVSSTPPGLTEKQVKCGNIFESTFSDAFENPLIDLVAVQLTLKTTD